MQRLKVDYGLVNMGFLSYTIGVNLIKSSRVLEAPCYPFDTRVRGTDTMSHSIPNQPALKVCSKCGESKPLSDFTQTKTGPDAGAYYSMCRPCKAAYARAYHRAHRESELKKMHDYDKRTREKRSAEQRVRRTDPDYRQKRKEIEAKSLKKNAESMRMRRRGPKTRAREAVQNAVRKGRIPPSNTMVCEICQEALAAHYHHLNGYEPEHWFDVVAICTECHGKEHRKP